MNINRHNYETYFLLYVDNELAAGEKKMVDDFLSMNPDLQEEMVMLKQSIVIPETVLFGDKQSLLKNETAAENRMEQLLLLLDDQLGATEKQQIEMLIANDETIKEEWELIKQTQLCAENAIVFPDKASLYKTGNRKVIPVRWLTAAAAAMLIGFGLWSMINVSDDSSSLQRETVSTAPKKVPSKIVSTTPDSVGKSVERTARAADVSNNDKRKQQVNVEKTLTVTKRKQRLPGNENHEVVNLKKRNISPTEAAQNINDKKSNKEQVLIVQPEDNTNKTKVAMIEIPQTETNVFVNAAFKESDEFATFDNEEEDQRKLTKVGGFFKKVKRVLERKTKINTGTDKNIKIANLTFAMQ
jgi:hypothetical protein